MARVPIDPSSLGTLIWPGFNHMSLVSTSKSPMQQDLCSHLTPLPYRVSKEARVM